MNSQSDAMPEASRDSQISDSRIGDSQISESRGIAPGAVTAIRPFYWSVRRELWENRSIYIAPLAAAAVTLLGYLIATLGFALSTTNMAQRREALEGPYSFAMGVIMGTAFIVSIFYSLDALHGERRDRSILFWKSLPVSDLITVLSKASIPLVVLPVLSFAIVVATELIMLGLSTLVLLASGLSVARLWTMVFQMWLMLLYHLVTVHVLWYAPIYGWLLLVSGWARRAAFLWAVLPWLAIGAVEKIALNTWHFAAMLGYRFEGGPEAIPGVDSFFDPMTQLTPGRFLSSPGLWIGLVVAVAFLAAAVRLRRCQGPI
jgi:ABC-2 type transport system permease protein